MELEQQARYHAMGNSYWWLVGKYDIIMDAIARVVPAERRLAVLDTGCGPGNLLDRLSAHGPVTGSDVSLDALRFCRSRGYQQLLCSQLDHAALRSETFDLVAAIDVLEHMPNDLAGLREIHRVLRPGGYVVLTVPAFQVLWGEHDELFGHYRRYRAAQVRALLQATQFELCTLSYFQPLYFLPLLLFRRWKRWWRGSARGHLLEAHDDFITLAPWLNRLLTRLLAAEKYVLRQGTFPFGTTLLGIGRKAGGATTGVRPLLCVKRAGSAKRSLWFGGCSRRHARMVPGVRERSRHGRT